MATDTTTIEDQLRALVRLQSIDSRIDQLTKLRGDLPDEIRDLEDEKAGLQTRLAKIDQDKKDGEVQRKKLKLDAAESEGLIRKYEEQQLQVRNNREYDALTKEIEGHRQRIAASLEEVERLETVDVDSVDTVEGADERLAGLDAVIAEKKAELERVVEETRVEQEGYEKQRGAAVEGIDERYLRAYERLRTRLRDGRAVVPIERGAAAGFMVPPQRQVEIRQRDRIIVSEHDGRILVDDALFREVNAEIDEA
jgi:hypothetical protein